MLDRAPRSGAAGPVLVLLAALALVYGPFVLSGGLLAVGDGLGYYFPVRALAALSLRLGELPFWNPANFAGVPLHGMLQAGVFFPGNWGFLVLPPVAAMNLAVLASSFGAGFSMYAFARALALGRPAALLAALPFMLAGYLGAHLEELTTVQVVGLIPAVLWALERRRPVALAAILALQLLAGYPQTCLITLAIAAAYVWHRGLSPWGPLAAGALAFAIAAVELGPVLDVIAQSDRMNLPYEEIVKYSLPPRQLPTLLFPYMFGGAKGALFGVPYWGVGQVYSEIMGYVGLAPMALSLVALAGFRRDPRVRFWAVLGLVGGVLALGDATPIYHLWAKLPVLRAIRVPGRHLLELDLAVCLLGALGLEALLDAEPARARRLGRAAAGALGLAMGGVLLGVGLGHDALVARIARWLPSDFDLAGALSLAQPAFWVPALLGLATAACLVRRAPRALLLVLLLDLGLYAAGQNVLVNGPRPGALAMPLPDAPYRALPLTPAIPYPDLARTRALGYPLFAAFWGERSASGYEAFVPARYGRLVGGLDNGGLLSHPEVLAPDDHVLDLLGVRLVRLDALYPAAPWQARLASPRWRQLPDQPGVHVYENTRALPRAWRVVEAVTLAPAAVEERTRRGAAFDPAHTALLEGGAAPPELADGSARVVTLTPNRLAVETAGDGPGLVLVNERFDPGWQAVLPDGRTLPVRVADALILAVEVPAGPLGFELRYRPPHWGPLVAISLAGLAGLLGWWLLGYRAKAARPANG
ncbi:MAG: putative rane protein [Cyanobacteria bacterium RYN_339]|nr:putative rane protein [Cyanobacteria bacterium RYN_339]